MGLKLLRRAGVELLTLGQYLTPGRPGTRFLPVERYVPPEQFAAWDAAAIEMGFKGVANSFLEHLERFDSWIPPCQLREWLPLGDS